MSDPGENSWTIQVLPERGDTTHSFRISARALLGASVGLGLVAIVMLVQLFSAAGDTLREGELTRLRAENRHLSDRLRTFEERVSNLGRALDDLSAREKRFRLVAGLPMIDPDVRDVGVGGLPGADPAREEFFRVSPEAANAAYGVSMDLDRLLRRAELLSSSISEASDSLQLHKAVFLARPSIQPVRADEAWISSSYSSSRYHPILLHNRPHEGIDISARPGSPIMASAHGTVRFAGTRRGYGKMVEIDHGYGYRTRYAHASRILVRRGEKVSRGDVIGEVGQTGLTTGPNLHYEVLIEDRPVNPREFFLADRLFE